MSNKCKEEMIDKIHDILTKGAVFDSEPIYCIILMNGKVIIDMDVTTKGNKEPIDIRHFLSIRSTIYNLDINSPEEVGNLTVDKTITLSNTNVVKYLFLGQKHKILATISAHLMHSGSKGIENVR